MVLYSNTNWKIFTVAAVHSDTESWEVIHCLDCPYYPLINAILMHGPPQYLLGNTVECLLQINKSKEKVLVFANIILLKLPQDENCIKPNCMSYIETCDLMITSKTLSRFFCNTFSSFKPRKLPRSRESPLPLKRVLPEVLHYTFITLNCH